jgi:hypothetical protein
MFVIQRPYTPSNGKVFQHGYTHRAAPGAVRSTPKGIETAALGCRFPPSREHPIEGTTSAVSWTPAAEPEYRATSEPESPA